MTGVVLSEGQPATVMYFGEKQYLVHAYGLHLGLIKIIFGATGGLKFLVYFCLYVFIL